MRIRYKADLNGGYLQCLPNGLQFVFRNQQQYEKLLSYKLKPTTEDITPSPSEYIIDYHAYRVNFIRSNPEATIIADEKAGDYSNYFLGNDPSKWASGVNNFGKLSYNNLYKNIDLELFEQKQLLKYQFTVHLGANVKDIAMEYEGVVSMALQQRNVIIKTSVNQVTELAPVAFQLIEGVRTEVPCKFVLRKNRLSFDFPEGYNKDYDLVIDPVLIFSTFSGSMADNWGFTATYDDQGNTYSGGICFNDVANGYPVSPGAFRVTFGGGEGTYYGGCDIAIIKYNPTGNSRIYATYLGGSRNDLPHSLIVDITGNLLVFGTTGSPDFPMNGNPYDNSFNGGTNTTYDNVLTFNLGVDMYVAKLNPLGTQLLASTYLGGTGNDGLNFFAPLSHNYADGARGEINIDKNNNVYVVSTTASTNFPVTAGAFQMSNAGGALDGCISVFDNNLSNLIWSSYLGGSQLDAVYGITIADNMSIYVCGGTTSTNFPTTTGAFQTTYNGGTADGFITKISTNGNTILASTYYGSPSYDQVYLMDKNKQGFIYVFGQSADPGSNFIQNAAWNQPGGGQFITKFNPDLASRSWATRFGTGNGVINISPTAFLVDLCSKIYLSGWGGLLNGTTAGTSGLPISANAFQNITDNNDFYLLVIKDDASAMEYGTYFGGPLSQEHVDGGTSRFDRMGKIYQSVCAGCGGNDDFPTTPGAWSNTNNSTNCNNGAFKFDFILPVTIADFQLPPVVCLPSSLQFTNTSYTGGPGMTYNWNFGDGTGSTLQNPSHTYATSGVYLVTLIVIDNGTCNFSDTVSKQVVVLSNSSDTIPKKHICKGDFTQIGILPTGDPNVTFQWIPATFLSDPNICNPIANPPVTSTYTLLVSNGLCTDTLRQKVVVYDLDAYAGNDTTTCGGSITLTANTAQDANIFHWSTNHNFTDWLNSPHTNPSFSTNITAPSYFYIMVDNGYCTGIDSVFVGFEVVVDSFNLHNPSCYDSCNGSISAFISAGTPPFNYNWSTGDTISVISNLCAGTYSLTITDNNNCVSISSVILQQPDEILSNVQLFNIPCEEACIGIITLNTSGGTPPYSYIWNTGNSTNTISGLCAGTYSVTITDSEYCQMMESYSITVDSIFSHVDVYSDKDTLYQGQSTGLHATQIANCIYSWTPVSGLDNPYSSNPTASPMQTITYYLTISDPNGCIYIDSLKIIVLDVFCDDPYVYVPNAFTPDGDDKNDVLYVRSKMVSGMDFLVYDRWGEKVFESHDMNIGWDGTFRGKKCDPGVFVYYLDATCHNKAKYLKKGNVTLIR